MAHETAIDPKIFQELKALVGADFIGELIETFFEEAPVIIKRLEEAHQANNPEVFRRNAHSLKSNAASFGAKRLSEQAKALEMLGRSGELGQTGDSIKLLSIEYKRVAEELKRLRHDSK